MVFEGEEVEMVIVVDAELGNRHTLSCERTFVEDALPLDE